MSENLFRRQDGALSIDPAESAPDTFLCQDGERIVIVMRRGKAQLFRSFSPSAICTLIQSLQAMIATPAEPTAPAVNPPHDGRCLGACAEDCAEEIEIRVTFDGRVGVLLHSGKRLMHCPLSPDSARHVAGLLVSSAEAAEAGKTARGRLN